MSGLSDLVTPLGYSPNLKVQFWKSLPSNVRKKESKQSICLMNIWHHIGYLPPSIHKTISPLTSTSPYILFYQTIHLYYTTQREGGQPLLVWMSIQWKEFQTATKRFDSCEFNDKTTFCCVVKSIEWTSTYIRNMIKPSGECVCIWFWTYPLCKCKSKFETYLHLCKSKISHSHPCKCKCLTLDK
jgi:hypothetical protein